MKCPYEDCRKDYNDEVWHPVYQGFVLSGSREDAMTKNRLYLVTRECHFCNRYFHDVSVGNEVWKEEATGYGMEWNQYDHKIEPLVSYPTSKTKFEAKSVPAKVREPFNEAERCRAVGSLTGAGACLRKSVYALCDDKQAPGGNYREKIGNLPVKAIHRELLLQFKWLGDNVTKPGEEKYTSVMIDAALQILPTVIDGLYKQDESEAEVAKMLAKARSVNPEVQDEKPITEGLE